MIPNEERAHYTRFSARNAVRPVCNPVQAESEIASAKGRVKPLTRLLRCATALPGDSAPRLRLRRLVWPKGSFPAQQARPECPGL